MGLHRAWPHAHIVGYDIKPQRHYPFDFVCGDALEAPLDGDFYWASPPCQKFSVTKALHRAEYPDLIAPVRARLVSTGRWYVIENVPGAPLIWGVQLCGSAFGLGVRRHRRFESSQFFYWPGCRHDLQPAPLDVSGTGGPCPRPVRNGGGAHRKPASLAAARQAMGINWMTRAELNQAIPPAYSEYIARQLTPALAEQAA